MTAFEPALYYTVRYTLTWSECHLQIAQDWT